MAQGKKEKPINKQQKKFCEEYIFDWNGTRAYQIAYPKVKTSTSRVSASELLTNPNIQDYIKQIQEDIEKQAGISRLMVLLEYKKLAFSSIAHLHDSWVDRKDFDTLTKDQKDCISEIQTRVIKRNLGDSDNLQIVDVEEIKIKLFDKKGALDSLTKFFGYAEPEKIIGQFDHNITINEIKTEGLSKQAQQLLLEISKKQLTDGVTEN